MKFLIALAFSMAILACHSKKAVAPEATSLNLLLADGYNAQYLEANYQKDGFVEASRANRTLNIYRASFTVSDLENLKEKLLADPIVLEILTEDSLPTNSTNVGHSNSKPVIKNK